jgi:alcohol dehydrogenase YqhD (iron-dependent ADH family)
MLNFHYNNPARIFFGDGAEHNLYHLLKEYNVTSLMFVYSGNFVKTLGIWDAVKDACRRLDIDFLECGDVVPNPKIELIRSLIAVSKKRSVDFVLAAGGGSSVDTAKAIALGIPYDGDVWDFFDQTAVPHCAVSIGAITTLPASGSETSNAAIISNGLMKLGFEDDMIIPKFAIMNPKYTLDLPAYQTSCGCADILSHLLERYFSDTAHTDATDYMIEGAICAVLVNSLRLMKEPSDYNARAEIQWLASIAHNGILDTGRAADWGSHRIEHELSGQYGITHGEGMAVVSLAWCRYMAKTKPYKLAQLASRVFHVDSYNHTEQEMAYILADKLEAFFKSLNLKTTLTEMGIDDTHFEEMANRATNHDTASVGHYVPLHVKEFVEILKLAI